MPAAKRIAERPQPQRTQPTLECGGLPPPFRSSPTARVLQREAPPRLFTPPKNRRHSEERPWRRRISSMLQHPGHHDEAALDVMSRAIHHWMRFFARLRMTANAVCSVPFVRVAAERSASPSLLVLPTEPFFAVILRSEATKDLLLARSPPAFAVDRQTRLR
jgi:hypothetical protein